MDRKTVIAQFPVLFPLAIQWATTQENEILELGVVLNAQQSEDAWTVGVRHPGRVRLLRVEVVPHPEEARLRAACDAINFLTAETRGLTLGYGIFIRDDCWPDRALVVHELVHTAQYERFGGTEPFLRQYLTECLTVGYENSPLEQEARMTAARLRF